MSVLSAIFWLCAAVIAYALFVYPLLSVLLAVGRRSRTTLNESHQPNVSFIIAAYNEERAIAEKLEQTLRLDYPREKLEIIVASDGSKDRTDDIVRTFAGPGVRLFRCDDRLGKTHTLNGAVAAATGEIIIFSDATGVFSPNSIRALVAHFADPTIGCVAGRVAYRYGKDTTSSGFRFYQRVAVAVRRAESVWGSETSVSGAIHAMRRSLYRPSNPAFSLDVINPVHTVAAGQRVAYEYDAVCWEESRTRLADEFRVRVRIGVRATSMIPYITRTLLSPPRWAYLWQMVSHKFLRWWLWLPLLMAFVSNALLVTHGRLYQGLFGLQLLGYGLGLFALFASTQKWRVPGLSGLTLFVVGNAAMAVGAVKAIFGQRMPKWEPVR